MRLAAGTLVLIVVNFIGSQTAFARKTNEPVYVDPFDLAAGGANLTRATQEGVMFANPALMPWGKKVYRYSGFMPAAWSTSGSTKLAQTDFGSMTSDELVDTVFSNPIHMGASTAASVILSTWGLALVTVADFDIEGKATGSDTGNPSIDIDAGVYGVGAMSFAEALSKWFSIGLTTKYIIKTEPYLNIPVTDRQGIEELAADPTEFIKSNSPGSGSGFDLGTLFFAQGKSVDYRLAFKVDDIGDTNFSGEQEPFKQTMHVGQAITFHSDNHALHCAVDYRDIGNAYDDKLFKKVFAGVKGILDQHFAVAVGLYNGIPSYGLRLDLWAIKMGITRYSREMTNVIGEKRRDIVITNFAMGW